MVIAQLDRATQYSPVPRFEHEGPLEYWFPAFAGMTTAFCCTLWH
jgi:hypothetical protein